MAAVWGAGEHTHEAVRTAVSRLNRLLPAEAQIKNIRLEGYVLSVDLKKVETKYQKTEQILEKSRLLRYSTITALASLFLFSIIALGLLLGIWPDPPPVYTVRDTKAVFTRDHLVGIPQLSPDGRYVAHRLSNKMYIDDYLAITDLTSGETSRLAKMRFDDGLKWDLGGNKMVYQRRTTDSCQIRLLRLDADKAVTDDSLLDHCPVKSGMLSFAWFNEHEFYVNLVDSQSAGLPLHQLYSFDIRSKKSTKILATKREGGVGFYSLEYDQSTATLYMLKTTDFISSDFYRYRDGTLAKLAAVDHLVSFYTVADNRLIYKNTRNDFVINQPAGDFADQKVLLPSPTMPIDTPHLGGNKLTYMAGETFGFALHKRSDNKMSQVELAEFNPGALANYRNTLIFASGQTGIHQIYQLSRDDRVIQISDMQHNERIKHIEVVGDLFAVSYYNKVNFYRYRQNKWLLLNALPGYSNAFIAEDGETVLLSTVAGSKTTGTVVEMRLSNLQPTGLVIHHAIMAMYYRGNIVYVSDNHQLKRFGDGKHQVMASNINIRAFEQTTLQGDKLYYVATPAGASVLFVYDFTRSLSENRLLYCGSTEFGHFVWSFSLNRTTIRLKGPHKLPQICSPSRRALFSDRLLAVSKAPLNWMARTRAELNGSMMSCLSEPGRC